MERIVSQIGRFLGLSKMTWRDGLSSEIDFWNQYFATKGSQWPQEYLMRLDPHLPLQDYITELIDVPDGKQVNILDVGAGPLTRLGKHWPGRQVNITAVDPLAEEYDRILKKYNIEPPIRTVKASAEALHKLFPPNYFDLVYARNCIDHCFNAKLAIREMLRVAKPNCYVFMEHRPNEGETQGYHGLHQWNFFMKDGDFYIGNIHKTTNISKELAGLAQIECSFNKNNWLITKLRKEDR